MSGTEEINDAPMDVGVEITETERDPLVPPKKTMKRGVNGLQLMMMTYFSTCGGPFGIESAIEAAGPLYTLIGLVVIPLIWALPQALMAAELSLLFNTNGGNVVWVQGAFGDFVGWVNAYNNVGSTFSSMTLLVVLFVDYLPYQFSWWEAWLIKFGFIVIVTILNLVGLRFISRMSMLLAVLVVSPFVAMIIVTLVQGHEDWNSVLEQPPASYCNWALFCSTLIWAYGGYDSMGSLAGEVKGGKKTFVGGILGSFPLILINYFAPAYFGYLVNPHYNQWGSGYFTTIAYMLAEWLGIWTVVASTISSFGSFSTILATLARCIWVMAQTESKETIQQLPAFLSWSWQRHTGTIRPIAAIVFTGFVTSLMAILSFNTLVQIYLILRVVNLSCEYGALIRLRYTQPDTPRPFKVGGKLVAWLLPLPSLLLAGFAVFNAEWRVWAIGLTFNAFVIISYWVVFFIKKHTKSQHKVTDKINE